MKLARQFHVVAVSVSLQTGTRKTSVPLIQLQEGGVVSDAHFGLIEDRQVSLLAIEEIEEANNKILHITTIKKNEKYPLQPGDFAENICTRGVELHLLPIGTRLHIGSAVLEVSKIGKSCHHDCEIKSLVGDCIMPKRGIFAKVVKAGEVKSEDIGTYDFG